MKIGEREVGHDQPCFIIAEACDNHLGSVERAMEMVRQAKLAGADAIKFQHHLPDEEMLPDVPRSENFKGESLYSFLKANALSLEAHVGLQAYCRKVGIQYLCTPFSWAAAVQLRTMDVAAYKIGSGEMTDIPLLVRIATFGKPMIVSTGMSDYLEIQRTYEALWSRSVPLALLNCVSEYPPAYEDVNLDVITTMRQMFPRAVIGHSDHTPDLPTSFAAVTLGACIIEKHVTLDKRQPGPDQSVSIDFRDLASLVDGVRKIEAARGMERRVHKNEAPIREWAFRSLVVTRGIRAGEVITANDLWSKRPGTGIPSWRMDEFVGRRARVDIVENTLLVAEDVE